MNSQAFSIDNSNKENLLQNDISSQIYQNHIDFLCKIIENRYNSEVKVIEDRYQLAITNLMYMKEIFIECLPNELLRNITVQQFFEEYDASFENLLKEIIKKMNMEGKNQLLNKNYDQFMKKPKFEDIFKGNEDSDEIEKKFQKIFKSPFSKKKQEFTDKNDSVKSPVFLEKSLKKPWVP